MISINILVMFFSLFLYVQVVYGGEITLKVLFCFMLFSVCVLTYRFPSLFSYLLLHNKSPQNLVALNSANLFSQNLCGSGIFYLSLWFWLGSLSWGCSQDVGEHCRHLTTLLRLEDLLQRWPSDRALAGSLSSSLAIGGRLSSSRRVSFGRVAQVSSWHVSDFCQSNQRVQRWKPQCLLWPGLQSPASSFLHSPFGYISQPYLAWEGSA